MTDKAPPLLIQKTPTGLIPYGAHSPVMLEELPMWQVATVKPRRGRTLPRNSAYWAGLQQAVRACGAWPTAHHAHDDLKEYCGYVETYTNPFTGELAQRVQSTAFDKMHEPEFAAYFRLAQMKFINTMGFDPWERN